MGMWRVGGLNPNKSTIGDLQARIEQDYGVATKDQSLYLDPGNTRELRARDSFSILKIQHGHMLYLKFQTAAAATTVATAAAPATRKAIAEDGSIIVKTETVSEAKAVRAGLGSLRSRKLHWTMDELMQLEANYTFKITRQPKAVCNGVSLDMASCNDFQRFCRQLKFKQYRGAWLYGRYVRMLPDSKLKAEEEKPGYDSRGRKLKVKAKTTLDGDSEETQVRVECLYEPPQLGTAENLQLLEDPNEEYVESIAKALGLERVGFAFAHPGERSEGYRFQSNEVLLCAENQLLAGDTEMKSPFVTVKVMIGEDGNVAFDAFQMSKQCLEMTAEGALEYDPKEVRGCRISDTYSAMVEAKEVGYVDNDFFLCNVPVMQHQSFLSVGLEQANRPIGHNWQAQPASLLQNHLQAKRRIETVARFSDFQVLLLLGKVLDKSSTVAVCMSIADKSIPLEDGHKMILDSLSGI
jgi:nuclear protein localization protein 4 homolog